MSLHNGPTCLKGRGLVEGCRMGLNRAKIRHEELESGVVLS